MSEVFHWPVRVYWEDTDAGGVVFYANYLKYLERARTEWLRSLNVEQDVLKDQHGLIFVVRHVAIDYLKPARFNDALQVTATLSGRSKASATFHQTILRDTQRLIEANVRIVCLDAQTFRPKPLPSFLFLA
ncbi:MAG: tol-pal system-associated acyl-CoA thioesterase [Methylococcales bacterium]|nr:tol-pal system-associated acyl-CoA thioesterase [Methylococcales bacterium]